MIEADNAVFLELLGDLFGAHSRNVKADIAGGYLKGLRHMTLGEFRSVVEHSLDQLQNAPGGEARPPTVAEIWQMHRDLKRQASSSTSSSAEPAYRGDHWAVAANLLLLRHVVRKDKPANLDYAPDSCIGRHGPPVVYGEHTAAIAKILTRWMNTWVIDVREAEAESRELDRRKHWLQCMADADRQVGEYLERYVRRAVAA